MFTSPALLDRRLDDVVDMIVSAARGDELELAELLSVEALVDERAEHLFGDTRLARTAAGIVVGPAPLALNVAAIDVALIVAHSWLGATTTGETLEAAARMDALFAELVDADELCSAGYLPNDYVATCRRAMAEHHDAVSLHFSVSGVRLVALPTAGGISVVAETGETLCHVSLDDDTPLGMTALDRGLE